MAHVSRAGEGIVRRFVGLADEASGRLMGVSAATVRRLALSLPETAEAPHHDMTSFRVAGKIFATMPPEGGRVHVFVGDEEVDRLCRRVPGCGRGAVVGEQTARLPGAALRGNGAAPA